MNGEPDKRLLRLHHDINEQGLRSLVSTTTFVGERFFSEFTRQLAEAYNAKYAIACELIESDPTKVRTLAFWGNGKHGENFEYEVKTTPCETVYEDGMKYFPENIQSLFADDADLVHMEVHSYFGIPMQSHSGETIGHICMLGEEPLAEAEIAESYFKIFAARAGAELERLKMERENLRHQENMKQLIDEQTATLRQAKEIAEIANRAKSEFLARMTFELKTPLSTVLGYAALLQEGEEALSESQQKFISNIITAGWHLDHVIGEILDVSQIESGELITQHSKCNLMECLGESIKVQEIIARQRGIKIGCLYDTHTAPHIYADKGRIIQIFSNLINNAIKFNHDNGLVKIKIEPIEPNRIRVSVIDTGDGINVEDQHKVFEKFERFGGNEGWITGTGVGLAITKRLVEYMGGQIGMRSVPNEGSTFWVEFNSM